MIGADGLENVPHRDWIIAFDRVLNEVKAHMKSLGREDEFFGARVSNNPVVSAGLVCTNAMYFRSYTALSALSRRKSWTGTSKTALP